MTKQIWILMAGAAAAFAQGQTGWIASPGANPVVSHMALEGQTGPVTGKPLEAIELRHNVQTLSDGTKLESSSSTRFYRDALGRTRVESPERVEIYDPVAGATYDLDPQRKTFVRNSTGADTVMIALQGGSSRVSRTSGTPRSDMPSHVRSGDSLWQPKEGRLDQRGSAAAEHQRHRRPRIAHHVDDSGRSGQQRSRLQNRQRALVFG